MFTVLKVKPGWRRTPFGVGDGPYTQQSHLGHGHSKSEGLCDMQTTALRRRTHGPSIFLIHGLHDVHVCSLVVSHYRRKITRFTRPAQTKQRKKRSLVSLGKIFGVCSTVRSSDAALTSLLKPTATRTPKLQCTDRLQRNCVRIFHLAVEQLFTVSVWYVSRNWGGGGGGSALDFTSKKNKMARWRVKRKPSGMPVKWNDHLVSKCFLCVGRTSVFTKTFQVV